MNHPNAENEIDPETDEVGAGSDDDVQGEGDDLAARRFQWKEREFVQDEDLVRKIAREAADALDGPEREELERARRAAAEGRQS